MHLQARPLHILYQQKILWLHELLLLLHLLSCTELNVTHRLHGILSCCLHDTFTDYYSENFTNTNWSDIIFFFFFFLRGISLQFISASRCCHFLYPNFCASSATTLYKSAVAVLFLLGVNIILRVLASMPDGPGAPFISITVFFTISWLMLGNVTG